jgi:hypothetical protein
MSKNHPIDAFALTGGFQPVAAEISHQCIWVCEEIDSCAADTFQIDRGCARSCAGSGPAEAGPYGGTTLACLRIVGGSRSGLGVGLVGDADFGEAIAKRVAGKAEEARGLALVAVGAAQSFADHFVFPLLERHAFGRERDGVSGGFGARGIEMDIAGLQERAQPIEDQAQKAFETAVKFARAARAYNQWTALSAEHVAQYRTGDFPATDVKLATGRPHQATLETGGVR